MKPYLRRWKTGGLGQFDEASLAEKQVQLMRLREERAALEAEIQSVKTGVPIKPRGASAPIPSTEEVVSAAQGIPGWVWLAAGAGLLLVLRGRKAS